MGGVAFPLCLFWVSFVEDVLFPFFEVFGFGVSGTPVVLSVLKYVSQLMCHI